MGFVQRPLIEVMVFTERCSPACLSSIQHMSRRKLVAGNWKMHGSLAANEALVRAVVAGVDGVRCDIAVCPPFAYLGSTKGLLGLVKLGAQNLSEHEKGAFTGEVAGAMLKDVGCHYVIVGHSERRALYGESSALVAKKFAAALAADLTPILCVGETLAEREAGRTEAVVAEQLDAVLNTSGIGSLEGAVVAYEPVWAIGTGKTASPEQAQTVHAFIRARLKAQDARIGEEMQILYGGSVKAANAASLFACADIDGGLIGGAALLAEEFVAICRAAG